MVHITTHNGSLGEPPPTNDGMFSWWWTMVYSWIFTIFEI